MCFSRFYQISVVVMFSTFFLFGGEIISAQDNTKSPFFKIHFIIPIHTETYTAVTKDNIEKEGRSVIFMYKHQFPSDLLEILRKTPTNDAILLNGIRIKAEFVNLASVYYVDRNGIVLQENTGELFRISEDQIKTIEDSLKSFVGVVDTDSYTYE